MLGDKVGVGALNAVLGEDTTTDRVAHRQMEQDRELQKQPQHSRLCSS